ncbi:hypothetical protein CSC52_0702 [Staphylococcus aureus]|nr:hypothetical protein CSC52_0702 [Staphylococcus aureus]
MFTCIFQYLFVAVLGAMFGSTLSSVFTIIDLVSGVNDTPETRIGLV